MNENTTVFKSHIFPDLSQSLQSRQNLSIKVHHKQTIGSPAACAQFEVWPGLASVCVSHRLSSIPGVSIVVFIKRWMNGALLIVFKRRSCSCPTLHVPVLCVFSGVIKAPGVLFSGPAGTRGVTVSLWTQTGTEGSLNVVHLTHTVQTFAASHTAGKALLNYWLMLWNLKLIQGLHKTEVQKFPKMELLRSKN